MTQEVASLKDLSMSSQITAPSTSEEQPLTNRPLRDYDHLFPGVNFMEITDKRDGSQRIVGTRRNIWDTPMYKELEAKGEYAEICKLIAEELTRQYEISRHTTRGVAQGFSPAPDQPNRATRRKNAK